MYIMLLWLSSNWIKLKVFSVSLFFCRKKSSKFHFLTLLMNLESFWLLGRGVKKVHATFSILYVEMIKFCSHCRNRKWKNEINATTKASNESLFYLELFEVGSFDQNSTLSETERSHHHQHHDHTIRNVWVSVGSGNEILWKRSF